MSCRLEALKRRYAPDIEANTSSVVDDEPTVHLSPAPKRARTIDVDALQSALNSAASTSLQQSHTRYSNLFNVPDLSRAEISAYVRAETKSLRRRKLIPRRTLPFDDRTEKPAFGRRRSPIQNVQNSSSDSEGEPSSPKRRAVAMEASGDRKMFTSEEVELLIQRLLGEQKARLVYEFEGILQQKLTEQAEAFMRYTQDAVQREMRANSERHLSYLS